MGRLRSSSLQVELCNLILELVRDHFALGFALCAKPNFFAKIEVVVGEYAGGHNFSLPNPVFISVRVFLVLLALHSYAYVNKKVVQAENFQ